MCKRVLTDRRYYAHVYTGKGLTNEDYHLQLTPTISHAHTFVMIVIEDAQAFKVGTYSPRKHSNELVPTFAEYTHSDSSDRGPT